MFYIFTKIADWSVEFLGLSKESELGSAVHFFIEDSVKIFILMYVLIFAISLFRFRFVSEKTKRLMSGKSCLRGYLFAVFWGAITPFCSCSSIPIFMGFIASGVPFGVSVAFLVSSPLVSEIAVIMLFSMGKIGIFVAFLYVLSGSAISVLAGFLADKFNLEKYLALNIARESFSACGCKSKKEKLVAGVKYANAFAFSTLKSLYFYILLGLFVGAFIHGYVPQEFFEKHLGADNLLAVPTAALIGIPMYASQAGVVPILWALLEKGVPVGTALAAFMSIVAISLPEMIMLRKVFSAKLLCMFVGYLLFAFIITGYLLNFINFLRF